MFTYALRLRTILTAKKCIAEAVTPSPIPHTPPHPASSHLLTHSSDYFRETTTTIPAVSVEDPAMQSGTGASPSAALQLNTTPLQFRPPWMRHNTPTSRDTRTMKEKKTGQGTVTANVPGHVLTNSISRGESARALGNALFLRCVLGYTLCSMH